MRGPVTKSQGERHRASEFERNNAVCRRREGDRFGEIAHHVEILKWAGEGAGLPMPKSATHSVGNEEKGSRDFTCPHYQGGKNRGPSPAGGVLLHPYFGSRTGPIPMSLTQKK